MGCTLPYPLFLPLFLIAFVAADFDYGEATIADIQAAFKDGRLTSRQLVEHYLERIKVANPHLHAVIEVNPDALSDATRADVERSAVSLRSPLHGIPVLLKDNIATRDRLNTTAGSFALLGSVVAHDAGVVKRLRHAGAIILGKASMSQWNSFRSMNIPPGWSARGGQGRNPYTASVGPCGSSSGPAIAVAANLVTVALGTETDGSLICPAASNSVVGFKPTVGLTSRSGVVPISPRQDTVGPIGRTVADTVALLDAIVGFDPLDAKATSAAGKLIPIGGFQQFLNVNGLKGKRVGILRRAFNYSQESVEAKMFATHFETMKRKGAILIDNLDIANMTTILNPLESGEAAALMAEFKIALNEHYLKDLVSSQVRSLADIIAFNIKHSVEERTEDFGQTIFLAAQSKSGIGIAYEMAIKKLAQLSTEGMEKLMKNKWLDAIVFPDNMATPILAIGGYPGISVPAGYDVTNNVPIGICFGGLRGSEPKLINIAYAFEQATRVRKSPPM